MVRPVRVMDAGWEAGAGEKLPRTEGALLPVDPAQMENRKR
jgi:hypothetical protein